MEGVRNAQWEASFICKYRNDCVFFIVYKWKAFYRMLSNLRVA